MARRKSSATATPKGHKRQISNSQNTVTPSTRSSKRIKTLEDSTPIATKVTPKKSKYFKSEDEEDEDKHDVTDASESAYDEETADASAYDDDDLSNAEPSESPSEADDYDSSEDERKKKVGRKTQKSKAQSKSSPVVNRDDLWKEGVKTGLGPGKQVFIAKPKPRGDGGIKYQPHKIHPNTMLFLADLEKNNDREWLKLHDPDYRQSWKDWESFVDALTEKLAEVDATIPELPPKDLVFRIYRDVRFSKDSTPYKAHFSAAWSRTGRKGPYAAYYVQIKPGGQSLIGTGLWRPEAPRLALMRQDIDRHPERLRGLLTNAAIRRDLLGGVANEEKKAIKAFTKINAENALKSKPKGYEADHPNIELLRLRDYFMVKHLSDEDVASAGFLDKLVELFRTSYPFVTYLNSIVMPDEADQDEGDDEDEEGEPSDDESA